MALPLHTQTNQHPQPATRPETETVETYQTDLGNAERFARQHAGAALFDLSSGWRVWNGQRWVLDSAAVWQLAFETARGIFLEAAKAPSPEAAQALAKHATRSEAKERIGAMLDLAQHFSVFATPGDAFDRDPFLLNVANGTINLQTGELRRHDPRDRITRLVDVVYDPATRDAKWEKFLDDAVGDPPTIGFLQKAAGYSLTASTAEEKLFLVLGPGGSGKSTFLDAVRGIMADYATVAGFDVFLRKQGGSGGGPTPEVARLRGARLVVASEADEGRHLAEGVVKQLTGGDAISARHLHREPIEFVPTFKLWLVANHAPRVSDGDSGMWRRIVRIPFERVVPADQRDPELKEWLRNPDGGAPAVLRWAVDGAIAWSVERLGHPPAMIEQATTAYRQAMNPLAGFFEERCNFGPSESVRASDLRAAYEVWARAEGTKDQYMLSPVKFAERLKDRGCENKRDMRGMVWFGIGLSNGHVGYEGYVPQNHIFSYEEILREKPQSTLHNPTYPTCPTPQTNQSITQQTVVLSPPEPTDTDGEADNAEFTPPTPDVSVQSALSDPDPYPILPSDPAWDGRLTPEEIAWMERHPEAEVPR